MNTISTTELSQLDNPIVVDVRETWEYTDGHAPAAVSVPLGQLVERVGEISRDDTVYVICESGGRSAQAVEWLENQGFDAVNVLGGTSSWRSHGLPLATGA